MLFKEFFKKSYCKPNKISVDKGSGFYNRSMKSLLQNNNKEMYSALNEGTFAVVDRFIRTLKNKVYKYMTWTSKIVNIDKLYEINTYFNSSKEINDKDPKFKIGDIVRISKHKNIFTKDYIPNWSEEVFVIKKFNNTVPWTYVISDLNGEEIVRMLYEKQLQKTN